MRNYLRAIDVRPIAGNRARGRLRAGPVTLPCALGPAGVVRAKREGDGGTPLGRLPIRRLWRRPDKGPRIPTGLAVRDIRPDDGWCDAADHPRYNRLVKLPFSASHETLWRTDGLYDLVLELGWNDRPARACAGSAIFLHAARPGFSPTAGCVAVAPAALRRLVRRLGPATVVRIADPVRRPRRAAPKRRIQSF
jgi:L,D-peptidoglycan transpeptidase YkuD (ErfK/YbiS/YcfS/YnhG family)